MNNNTSSISPGAVTPRHLLGPAVAAIAIGLAYLLWHRDRPVYGPALGLAFLFLSVACSSAYHVTRTLQKRIGDLEQDVATLKKSTL